jgi:MoaA/NifB/PqqE/SkfB family radical SAM enzyme
MIAKLFTRLRTHTIHWFLVHPDSKRTRLFLNIHLFILKTPWLCHVYHHYLTQFPEQVQIELTNSCNLACVMCHNPTHKRERGIMSDETFEKIVHELASWESQVPVFFVGFGEASVDKNYIKRLTYAAKAGIRTLGLTTNGTIPMTLEKVHDIISSGVKYIFIDVDATNADTYEKIRVGGKHKVLHNNIRMLLEENQKQGYPVWFILGFVLQDLNAGEASGFLRQWKGIRNVSAYIKVSHSWAGVMRERYSPTQERQRHPCHAAWNSFYIAWDGSVAFCCHDGEVEQNIGNCAKEGLLNVWNGPHRKRRTDMIKGDFTNLPLCDGCDDWMQYEDSVKAKRHLSDQLNALESSQAQKPASVAEETPVGVDK